MSLLLNAPPGVGVLEALEALPIDLLSVEELGEVLRTVGIVRGRVDAVDAWALAAFARVNGAQTDGATDTTAWLAKATKTSGRDAKRSVKRAGVIDALPALGAALAAGEVSAAHVDAVAGTVPAALLPKAGSLVAAAKTSTPEELAHKAQQLVIDNDGDGGAKRALRLKARQRVRFFDLDSGMRAMFGEWAPEATFGIERAVDLVADQLWRAEHPNRNPTRLEETSLKFRRAEAVSEIARRVIAGTEASASVDTDDTDKSDETAAGTSAEDATAGDASTDDATADADACAVDDGYAEVAASVKAPIASKRVTPKPAKQGPSLALAVLIDFQTLMGELAAKGICELFDGTPISPDTVRRMACDAAIIPMVLGSRGEVLNQGRRIYLPTVAQRYAVAVRDRHCAFPGCRRPAKWTDVHHIVPFKPGRKTGGRTDLDNLLLLCDKHHHMVHEGHWRLDGTAFDFDVYRPDGSLFDHVTRGPPSTRAPRTRKFRARTEGGVMMRRAGDARCVAHATVATWNL